MSDYFSVKINETSARRVAAGYPWVFRSEVLNAARAASLAPGSPVDFVREKGDWVARGFYNPVPQLAGRVLTRKAGMLIDSAFIESQIDKALSYRALLYKEPYYRLIHAESDGFPGLIIDRYGDTLVLQINTAGIESLYPTIEKALIRKLSPASIFLRNDSAAREQEGLAREIRLAWGADIGAKIPVLENGIRFEIDVLSGQKTGWFFDQRENRAHVAALARGKSVIDIFCHTGGFGVTALAGGAASCVFVDSSVKALADARGNAVLSGLAEARCIEKDAFEAMEALVQEGRVFDVVCVDPPAFIKSRNDMNAGLKGYQKLARLAAPLVAPGGFLFFASCSHHAATGDLQDRVAEGIAKSGRAFQLIRTSGAGPDHPQHPLLPETGYLKAFFYRLLD